MDTAGTIGVLAFISGVITFIVEIIKAWIPCSMKTDKGLLIPRKGKKPLLIPNQAVWPSLSMLIGVVIFLGLYLVSKYNPLGTGNYLGSVLSGVGVGTGGGAAGFRLKNVLGSVTGGTDASSAQNSGPATISEPSSTTDAV